jgi:DNA/RNA endonuclease G (NUC1)
VRRSLLWRGRKEAETTDAEKAFIKDNCLFGIPTIDPAAGLGPIHVVARKGHVLAHSDIDKILLWVAEHSTKDEVSGNLPRENPFAPDPKLLGKPRAELSDYRCGERNACF